VRALLLIAAATLCFAASEPRVSRASILAVEGGVDQAMRTASADPYDLLGGTRGTYLEGYGTLFTFEVDLVNMGSLLTVGPFGKPLTTEQNAQLQDRKLKKLPALKETMRSLITNASSTLEGLPPHERIAMEAILLNGPGEKGSKEIPRRIFMSAERQKLLDAKANHATAAELSALVEEQDR
jgi:hypothetical protein